MDRGYRISCKEIGRPGMNRQQPPPIVPGTSARFDTLSVRVYDEARRCSPTLTRGQARDVLAAVLRRLYSAGSGQLATAEFTLSQGVLAQELRLSRNWLGVLLTRLRDAGWIVFEGAGGATTRFRAGPQLLRVERLLREDPSTSVPTLMGA
jgi:hypothetical protein